MLAACVRYAISPEQRFVPLQVCLGILTLMGGALGFVTGIVLSQVAATRRLALELVEVERVARHVVDQQGTAHVEAHPDQALAEPDLPSQHRPRDRAARRGDLDAEAAHADDAEAAAGDVLLFVSDSWHRGTPSLPGGQGRLFLQCHYGRRDIAQRVLTTDAVNHVAPEARERIGSEREAQLLGLHKPFFYDG